MGKFTNFFKETFGTKTQVTELASQTTLTKNGNSYVQNIVPKTITQTRKDIKDWITTQNLALHNETPKFYAIQNLFVEVFKDLHLQSQVNNRMLKSLSRAFSIKNADGQTNEDLTKLLQNQGFVVAVNKAILETIYRRHSLIEFNYKVVNGESKLICDLIPRQNVDPVNGYIYNDYIDDKKIKYREQKEYGSWLIEFGEKNTDLGLLNGCVPHVLFKRFAQSCWSELCEIYGIPPRVMKTNTQDQIMVNRAKKMMQDMGSAAWFIIDDSESFEFAKGVSTDGNVYDNLIKLCNNEMSMGISGTVVGQDTKNGSNSKEKTSIGILGDLVDSDLSLIEQCWSDTVIPALQLIGILPAGVSYKYDATEDLQQLWKMVVEAANFLEVDPKWIETKFGIKVIGTKQQPSNKLSLNFDSDFFV
jgi:phage gp29-like protein